MKVGERASEFHCLLNGHQSAVLVGCQQGILAGIPFWSLITSKLSPKIYYRSMCHEVCKKKCRVGRVCKTRVILVQSLESQSKDFVLPHLPLRGFYVCVTVKTILMLQCM